MNATEITTKSALVRSQIPGVGFVINPYLGCGHACRYCYAVFMRKYSKHHFESRWGTFVEAKVNIADVLKEELGKKRKSGTAMLSSVCDPYQPVEEKFKLTRKCIEHLKDHGWGVSILTKSPLVLRDRDLFRGIIDLEVGFSISTDNEEIAAGMEPGAPPISDRGFAGGNPNPATEWN